MKTLAFFTNTPNYRLADRCRIMIADINSERRYLRARPHTSLRDFYRSNYKKSLRPLYTCDGGTRAQQLSARTRSAPFLGRRYPCLVVTPNKTPNRRYNRPIATRRDKKPYLHPARFSGKFHFSNAGALSFGARRVWHKGCMTPNRIN